MKNFIWICIINNLNQDRWNFCEDIWNLNWSNYFKKESNYNNKTTINSKKFKIKKYFKNFIDGEIQTKNLRAIYATLASNEFNKNTRKTHQSYIADILGHSPDDLNTVNSYFVFKLKE